MGPGLTNTYSFSTLGCSEGACGGTRWTWHGPGLYTWPCHFFLKFSVLARTRLSAPVLITMIAFARPCNDCWFNSLYSALNCKLGRAKDYVLFINGANHIVRGFALCINTNFLTEWVITYCLFNYDKIVIVPIS